MRSLQILQISLFGEINWAANPHCELSQSFSLSEVSFGLYMD